MSEQAAEHDARCEREYHKGVLIIDCLCRTRSAMADAWDEGFAACNEMALGDYWPANPYRLVPKGVSR